MPSGGRADERGARIGSSFGSQAGARSTRREPRTAVLVLERLLGRRHRCRHSAGLLHALLCRISACPDRGCRAPQRAAGSCRPAPGGLRVPRLFASAVVVVSVVSLLAVGILALAAPAKIWLDRTAQSLQKLEQRFRAATRPIEDIKKATGQLQEATQVAAGPEVPEVRVAGPALGELLLSGTPRAVASILSTTILVYFLLVTGDVFLRKLVNVIPTFRDKKRAVDITRQIESDISFYLLNFSLVNVGLGVAMTIVTALLGFPNPLLWGVLVAILNF